MDTLKKYNVEWKHINMKANTPSSELDGYLLSEMCKDAAIGVKLQFFRDYWDDKMGSSPLKYIFYQQRSASIFQLTT